MRKYHHVGIPTDVPREGETCLPAFKMYVAGMESSPFGIEWMRFEADAPQPELVKTVPHLAFEVDDLEAELAGQNVIIEPTSPSAGLRVAFIEHNGAPIELMQIDRSVYKGK